MTKEQILLEVATSTWQPKFELTKNLDAAIDSISNLHTKVKEIIEREISFAKFLTTLGAESSYGVNGKKGWQIQEELKESYKITFIDVCDLQKELFEYREQIVNEDFDINSKTETLPNQKINLGLRQITIEVAPAPMFLEDLKELCFPVSVNKIKKQVENWLKEEREVEGAVIIDYEKLYTSEIIEWYKIFQTIQFFEDLNNELGCIVINVLSYILTFKYLAQK